MLIAGMGAVLAIAARCLFLGRVTAKRVRRRRAPTQGVWGIRPPVNRRAESQKSHWKQFQWLFRDSYRIFIIKVFAILVKCITFMYQIVTVVNSHWIATELR